MITVVMVAEHILRTPNSEASTEVGNALFRALAPATRLHLLTYSWTGEELSAWLGRHQLRGHVGILTCDGPEPAARIDTLRRTRSWRVELVIDHDAECAAAAVAEGWTCLLWAPATFLEPSWRPDHPKDIRPWDALLEELNHQQEMRNHTKGDPQ